MLSWKKRCLCKKACYCDIDNYEVANVYVFGEIVDSNSSKQNFGKSFTDVQLFDQKCSDFSQKFSLVE